MSEEIRVNLEEGCNAKDFVSFYKWDRLITTRPKIQTRIAQQFSPVDHHTYIYYTKDILTLSHNTDAATSETSDLAQVDKFTTNREISQANSSNIS